MKATTTNTTTNKTAKAMRARKPRRQLPEKLDDLYLGQGAFPTPLDVVGGRGGISNNHEGNQRYWRRILASRPSYKILGNNNNAEKTAIAHSIMCYITSSGGKFLQKHSETGRWFAVPRKIVLDKIKQALRDKHVPVYARDLSMECSPDSTTTDDIPPTSIDFIKKCNTPITDILPRQSTDVAKVCQLRHAGMPQSSLSSTDELMACIRTPPSLNEFFEHHRSLDGTGVLKASAALDAETFQKLKSIDSEKDFSLLDLSRYSTIASTNDAFKIRMQKLPEFYDDTSKASLDLTNCSISCGDGHDVDYRLSNAAFAVPKKLSAFFNAKFDEAFASPASESQAV